MRREKWWEWWKEESGKVFPRGINHVFFLHFLKNHEERGEWKREWGKMEREKE